MSKSTHQIAVKATDQTAGAFSSIQNRAAAASAKLRSMLGGALAAAGTYFGFRSIAGAINELGTLSDIAQKSSLCVDDLTKSATALNVLGIQNMGVGQIAKAFQMMEKNTGRSGMQGFYQTIGDLGKIPDLSDRAAAAMAVFGRSGMELMPLINKADEGTEALQRVIEAMPGIPQAAADAGDKMNDAKAIGVAGFKKLWHEAVGSVCRDLDTNFKGGAREAALTGVAYMEYFVKLSWSHIKEFCSKAALLFSGLGENLSGVFTNLFEYYKTFFGAVGRWISDVVTVSWDEIKENGVFGKANERFSQAMSKASDKLLSGVDFDAIATLMLDGEKYRGALLKKLNEAKNKASDIDKAIEDSVESSGSRDIRTVNKAGDLLGGTMKRITNELIMGGSARSFNLAAMGPQVSNDIKRTNDYLHQLVDIAKRTEENTRDAGEEYTPLDC